MPSEKDNSEAEEGPPADAPPREGATRQFSMKLESWMSDVISSDFTPSKDELEASAPIALDGLKDVATPALALPPLTLESELLPAPAEPIAPAPVLPTAAARATPWQRARLIIIVLLLFILAVAAWLAWGASLRALF